MVTYSEQPPEVKRKIEELLAGINFTKIWIAMRAVQWTWHTGDGQVRFPSEEELEARAAQLLMDVASDPKLQRTECGGFKAGRTWDGCLYIHFVLEDSEEEPKEQL